MRFDWCSVVGDSLRMARIPFWNDAGIPGLIFEIMLWFLSPVALRINETSWLSRLD